MDVNLNDTFFYACADSEEIDVEDLLDLVDIAKEYGTYHALVAYCSVKRELLNEEEMPVPIWIKKRADKKNYLAAVKAIKSEIELKTDKFVDISFNHNQNNKELDTYGEKILWTHAKQPNGLVLQVASLPKQEIYGVGASMSDAMKSLRDQLEDKNNEKL